jgi:(S)-2-hydroxyglutarate dehydrogenase
MATGVRSVAIIGGGIIGLALARELLIRRPGLELTVLEKEPDLALHQTGRNSGVVHAGIYYPPGSLKAKLCVEGMEKLQRYCTDKGLAYSQCGKLVVALTSDEIGPLRALHERAEKNGVRDLALVDVAGIRELEPHATGVMALHSPRTAIVDFAAVTRALAADVEAAGGRIRTGTEVQRIRQTRSRVSLRTTTGTVIVERLVACAGLHSDRVARMAGDSPDPQIVPFRGDYLQLAPHRRHLVRGLIYPVPDPRYPFLGVHLTRRIDGEVLVGPNAVLALAREGYRLGQVSASELVRLARSSGVRHLFAEHWRTGLDEIRRSVSRRAFVAEARRYVPALGVDDVVPGPSGVRAQAVDPDGSLVDDFRITHLGRVTNVRNAPSPAATSSLAIAEVLADAVLGSGSGR